MYFILNVTKKHVRFQDSPLTKEQGGMKQRLVLHNLLQPHSAFPLTCTDHAPSSRLPGHPLRRGLLDILQQFLVLTNDPRSCFGEAAIDLVYRAKNDPV